MKRLSVVLLVLLIGIGGLWFVKNDNTFSQTPQESPSVVDSNSMYASLRYGIAFAYPASYQIEEREGKGNAEREHHTITLMRESDLPAPTQGEGSPAITIQIFQNNLDSYATENWIRNVSNSNFKLSPDGSLTVASIGEESGLRYSWDGLYRGETVAIARSTYVYVFSVTYADAADTIRTDFDALLRTVVFQ